MEVKFEHDVGAMGLPGFHTNPQEAGDFLVAFPFGEKMQDFAFPRSQAVSRRLAEGRAYIFSFAASPCTVSNECVSKWEAAWLACPSVCILTSCCGVSGVVEGLQEDDDEERNVGDIAVWSHTQCPGERPAGL